ncbi:MAG: hypothetical protein A3K10_07220 [Bacteroidetes bacterium RIFCSPLOWO2_12_FULL_31_6]|nr:MAG: hypothetical protein A3K10_07220 [Bacteroidetes bacterium RIFCSPLOWO2_12_FULL_31_6]
MNKLSIGLSIVAILLAGYTILSGKENNKLAYVNSIKLVEKYNGTSTARIGYEEKMKIWQANIDTLRTEFENRVGTYNDEKANMSEKEQQLQEQLLQAKQQQFTQYQQAIQQKAAEEDKRIMNEIMTKINSTVEEYGKKNGYQIILGANGSGNITYGDEALDITDEVLKELNK